MVVAQQIVGFTLCLIMVGICHGDISIDLTNEIRQRPISNVPYYQYHHLMKPRPLVLDLILQIDACYKPNTFARIVKVKSGVIVALFFGRLPPALSFGEKWSHRCCQDLY